MEQEQGDKIVHEIEETFFDVEPFSALEEPLQKQSEAGSEMNIEYVTSANVEDGVKSNSLQAEGDTVDADDNTNVEGDSVDADKESDLDKGDSDDCFEDEVSGRTVIAKFGDSSKMSSQKTMIQPSVTETETKLGERVFTCSLCARCYKCKKSAEYHIKVQHKAYSLFCQVCGKTFKLRYDLDRHLNVHKGIRPFPCPECDKSFVCRSSQMRHRKLHHLIGDIYKCHNCDKTFRAETDLKRHLLTHTGERPWSCGLCSKSFVSKSSLKVHEKSHDDSQKFSCVVCHKMFHIKTDLTRHESTHTGDLRWECAICQKKYSGKSAVKRHIKDSHIFGKVKYRKNMKVQDLLESITESSIDLKGFDAFAKYKEDNSVENLLKAVDSFVIYKGDNNDSETTNELQFKEDISA
ncbi:gastrula zinc finger protein XlCGF52.1-like [Mercenaria mercenaria]|uniref:gastrula zinc finger protein XlCGF52.1-like n=1 Tax=Mercenaria mercenaria TaxID=6596 RepID=UPI00234F50E4|nr:gastrula zinc finger protein XlCGF52.1-like [Mercenaria mercenaria]